MSTYMDESCLPEFTFPHVGNSKIFNSSLVSHISSKINFNIKIGTKKLSAPSCGFTRTLRHGQSCSLHGTWHAHIGCDIIESVQASVWVGSWYTSY